MKDNKRIDKNIPLKIQQLRKKIDQIDYLLLKSLQLRFHTVEKIACLKTKMNIPIFQKDRWNELIKDRIFISKKKFQLDSKFIHKIFYLIHQEAIKIQTTNVNYSQKKNRPGTKGK